MKHTPGKWYLADREIRTDTNCQSVCLIYKGGYPHPENDVAKANARLIAAAPELLDQLENLVAFLEGNYDHNEVAMQRCNAALVVIQKAKGETT
jgi:hypothetical protein